MAHLLEAQGPLIGQIQQPPRRGDQDIHALFQSEHLRLDLHTAKSGQQLDFSGQKLGKLPRHRLHLHGQLARGHDHQAARPARLRRLLAHQLRQKRQRISSRLARAGLRRGQHIFALQNSGYRRLLHRRCA